MKTLSATALVLAAACAISSCAKQSQDARTVRDRTAAADVYHVASDSSQDINARLEAASHLTQDQEKRLQAELLKEVPGDRDVKTLDAIWLLAKVGDRDAAEKLEQFDRSPIEVPGKVGYATMSTIAEIRKRESKADR